MVLIEIDELICDGFVSIISGTLTIALILERELPTPGRHRTFNTRWAIGGDEVQVVEASSRDLTRHVFCLWFSYSLNRRVHNLRMKISS